MTRSDPLYTVGHSNHSLEHFIGLLTRHEIAVLIDVRSAPYSRYSPQFNREPLRESLESSGIRYIYGGDYLGGRPSDPACYDGDGNVDYSRVAVQPFYERGIARLLDYSRVARTAIMCSEEDPEECHRHKLVAQTVLERGVPVMHIRGDARLETARMLPRQIGLFG